MTIEVTSSAFEQDQPIPKKYTADGENISPPLHWSGIPEKAKEIAVVCDDPDAVTADPWVHWVIYKIPATLDGLPEDIAKRPRPKEPRGVLQGKNSWPSEPQQIGYRGPEPPPGSGVHHYHFTVYALDASMPLPIGQPKKTLLKEYREHIIAQGTLTGTYKRD